MGNTPRQRFGFVNLVYRFSSGLGKIISTAAATT